MINRNDCNLPLSYGEGAADRQAVGHFELLQSHELHPASKSTVAIYQQAKTIWENQQPGEAIRFGSTELKNLGHTVIHNPYLNVKVDKRLIKNHNDVFRPEIMEFIRMLIVLSTQE